VQLVLAAATLGKWREQAVGNSAASAAARDVPASYVLPALLGATSFFGLAAFGSLCTFHAHLVCQARMGTYDWLVERDARLQAAALARQQREVTDWGAKSGSGGGAAAAAYPVAPAPGAAPTPAPAPASVGGLSPAPAATSSKPQDVVVAIVDERDLGTVAAAGVAADVPAVTAGSLAVPGDDASAGSSDDDGAASGVRQRGRHGVQVESLVPAAPASSAPTVADALREAVPVTRTGHESDAPPALTTEVAPIASTTATEPAPTAVHTGDAAVVGPQPEVATAHAAPEGAPPSADGTA
jgi:hypothetical protein